MAIGAALSHA